MNSKYIFKGLLLVVGLSIISCANEQEKVVFDDTMIPEVSSIPVEKDTSMIEFLGLTEQQRVAFEKEKAIWDKLSREIVASEDKSSRADKFRSALREYEINLYNLLDEKQREKFLDFQAYQVERGKPRQLMQSPPSE